MSWCLCSHLMWVDQILEDHFKGAKPPLAINNTEQTVRFSFLSFQCVSGPFSFFFFTRCPGYVSIMWIRTVKMKFICFR